MRRNIWGLAVMLMIGIMLSGCAPHQYIGTYLNPPKQLKDFTIQRADGGSFALSEIGDKKLLLYFGYTSCPDVCPTTLLNLRQALKALGSEAQQYQVAMLTVDPKRDTPERLNKYVKSFDPSFIGLYEPDQSKLNAIMADFGTFAEQDAATDTSGSYTVSHSAYVFVVDKSGMRMLFGYDTAPDQIAGDLHAFLREQ